VGAAAAFAIQPGFQGCRAAVCLMVPLQKNS